MLNRLQHTIQKHATGRAVLVLMLVTVTFSAVLNVSNLPFGARALAERSNGLMILDMRSGYTPDKVYTYLEVLGAEGRQLYATLHIAADLVFPVIYSLFFAFAIAWLLRQLAASDHPVQRLILLPFVAGLADLAENVSILIMNWAYPTRLDGLARLANLFTLIKFGLMPLGVAFIVIGLGILAWRRITGRQTRAHPAA